MKTTEKVTVAERWPLVGGRIHLEHLVKSPQQRNGDTKNDQPLCRTSLTVELDEIEAKCDLEATMRNMCLLHFFPAQVCFSATVSKGEIFL